MHKSFLPLWAGMLFSEMVSAFAGSKEAPLLAVSPLTSAQAKDIQRQWAQHLRTEVIVTNSIGMKMVLIPPGEFIMGLTEEQMETILTLFRNDPKLKKNYLGMATWAMLMMPAHRVRITRLFYMGVCEVTFEQFRQFVEATLRCKARRATSVASSAAVPLIGNVGVRCPPIACASPKGLPSTSTWAFES